jgi:hypothetical protein
MRKVRKMERHTHEWIDGQTHGYMVDQCSNLKIVEQYFRGHKLIKRAAKSNKKLFFAKDRLNGVQVIHTDLRAFLGPV